MLIVSNGLVAINVCRNTAGGSGIVAKSPYNNRIIV
jgi:hypothetical protein